MINHSFFSWPVAHSKIFDASGVVNDELLAKERKWPKRRSVSTLFNIFSCNWVRRYFISLWLIFVSQNVEQLLSLKRKSRDYIPFTFCCRRFQSSNMTNGCISHINGCILSRRSGNSWIRSIENVSNKSLARVSMFAASRTNNQTRQNCYKIKLFTMFFSFCPKEFLS